MIDARRWSRPSPAELRAMIPEGMTQAEIAARLNKPERMVRYWLSLREDVPEQRRISYTEWLALRALAEEAR